MRRLHPDVAKLTEQKGPLGYLNTEERQRLCASVILANPKKIQSKTFDEILPYETLKFLLLPYVFETQNVHNGKGLNIWSLLCRVMKKGRLQENIFITHSYNNENSAFMGKTKGEKQILLSYVKDIPVIMNLQNHVVDLPAIYKII